MLLPINKIKELYKEYTLTNKSLTILAKDNNVSRSYLTNMFIKYCEYKPTKKQKSNKITNEIIDEYYNDFLNNGTSQSEFAKNKNINRRTFSKKFKKIL